MFNGSIKDKFEVLVQVLREKVLDFYGDRLISLVVFGSVGRGVMRPDSDIDILLIADPLPRGRLRRIGEFEAVEDKMTDCLGEGREAGIFASLSPVFKTPSEARQGSPLFWDMVEDARILFDRNGFFKKELEVIRNRLMRLGAKRIWRGNAWYWDLKPDYKHGDEFEL
jgi:predicted nucleotidyltransferase